MCRRAFTIVEAGCATAAVLVLIIIIFIVVGIGWLQRDYNRRGDAVRVRGIMYGMTLWSQQNGDSYPLPSAIDLDDTTVAAPGAEKDTSANIFSLLVYNGYLPVELLVSPLEVGNIDKDEDYETDQPRAAINPDKALWDPALTADFTGEAPGNISYAHISPVGARAAHWTGADPSATRPVIANRGPQITSVTQGADGPEPVLANPRSNTLRIHGPAGSWEGNIGFQDNHVDFHRALAPEPIWYTTSAGARAADVLFYDEPDDPAGANAFLTITIPAAGVPGGTPIWD